MVYANEKFENDHSPISGKKQHHHINPQEIQNHQKRFRQRLVSFRVERAERAECTERESDEERTRVGTGGVFNTREGGETGVDLVVWRGGEVEVGGTVSAGEGVENGMEDKRAENEGESLPSNNFFVSASVMFLVARLASNFSVLNFSYSTSFVLTFNI